VRPDTAVPTAPHAAFSGLNANSADGEDIKAAAAGHLEYLTKLAGDLGVADVVAMYLTPIVGRWSDLQTEASAWREAAATSGRVSSELGDQLGRLDSAWEGKDADAFIEYIGEVGVAGGDLEDAMNAMADALEDVTGTLRLITVDMTELLTDTAELTSQSAMLPADGEKRARSQLLDAQQSAKALFEAARDVLEGFSRFCAGVDGPDVASRSIEINHPYPRKPFALPEDDEPAPAGEPAAGTSTTPAALASDDEKSGETSPSAAPDDGSKGGAGATAKDPGKQTASAPGADLADFSAGAITGATAGIAGQSLASGGMMPMMPMGMGMGGGGGGGGPRNHKSKSRTVTKPSELFGEPDQVVPPVIGETSPPGNQPPKSTK
jgi:uncharacterized protein YukE